MLNRLGKDPDAAEIAAFAVVCALALFVPPTPLVQQLAEFAAARGLSSVESGALLVSFVFASLAIIAIVVSAAFAAIRQRF